MFIKRKLSGSLTAFKNLRQNIKTRKKSSHRYVATIGIGGNIGDVKRRFNHLLVYFKRDTRVELLKNSLILQNPPFGFIEQDDFFNSIVVLKTTMQPLRFLDYLMRVEKKFLRKRSFKDAPRTLDLDIIFFDDRIVNLPKLQIPHPRYRERESVQIPLMDIYR